MASAFEIYLRSGRRVAEVAADTEFKFNPWHDSEDGRFTFVGQGRYFPGRAKRQGSSRITGMRGRGGSFGGGGASGDWKPNAPRQSANRSAKPTRTHKSPPVIDRAASRFHDQRVPVTKNGYNFSIDAHARTRQVSGEPRLQSQPRSKRAQADAGKPDRRTTDDGGHFIAARFGGPKEWFNHFAQDANFNRGEYRALEDKWARAVRSGKRVFVDIVPHYRGTSMRPHKLVVRWIIDGNDFVREFPNERRGR